MSDCACVYSEHEGDAAEFNSVTHPVARKAHKCVECNRAIEPGERYERNTGKWDGRIESVCTCADCQSIRSELFCGSWCYGTVLEDLWEHLADVCSDGSAGPPLSGLTPAARETVCEMIETIWEENDND